MSVNLAARISTILLAGTVVAASWAPALRAPHVVRGSVPIVATR